MSLISKSARILANHRDAAANPHYFAVKQPTDFLNDIVRENPRCIARLAATVSPSEGNMHLFGLRARPVAHFVVHASTPEKLKNDIEPQSCGSNESYSRIPRRNLL
jgi:hypothetical protein